MKIVFPCDLSRVTKAVKADSQEAKVLTTKPAEATKASIGQLPLG